MAPDQDDPPRRPGTPSESDLPPTGEEARARSTETLTPLIWLGLGLIVVVAFVVGLVLVHGVTPLPSIVK